jgi:hypothetical protein
VSTPLSLIARKAQLAGLRTALDTGGASLRFYANLPPALPDTTTAEPVLGSIALAAPCGALGQSGVAPEPVLATLTLTVPRVAPAALTGVIGWARFVNGAGDGFMDLPVGLPGSGMPVIVSALQVYANGEIQLVSCLIAE